MTAPDITIQPITSTIPAGYTARPVTEDDSLAILEFLNACAVAEIGRPDTEEDEVRNFLNTPGFTPATDTLAILAADGQMTGYAEYWNINEPGVHPFLYGRTHPDYTGQGIGSALFAWGEQRAAFDIPKVPAHARFTLRCGTLATLQDAQDLFTSLGYGHIRSWYRMVIEMDVAPPQPVWSDGITVRTLNPTLAEHRAVFEATEEAFEDHWGHLPLSFDKWMHWIDSDPDYDPTLQFLAMDGDQIAGMSLCSPKTTEDPGMGWVRTLGVRRNWRRRGVGLALLHHSFGEFWRRGQRAVGLGVDASSLTGATRLYERAGMHVARQMRTYDKELRPGEELSTQTVEA